MAKSTLSSRSGKAAKPDKPYPDFPLYAHSTRRWAKKIRGKLYYFGPWDDPQGALKKYLDQKDDLYAGRTPRTADDGVTVVDLANRFLESKENQKDVGEITNRTFQDYYRTCKWIVRVFGRNRVVSDLTSQDFESLRAAIAKQYKLVALGNEINRVRIVFKYGYGAGLIDKPMRFGPTFKRPGKRVLRKAKNAAEKRMFEADEIRRMIEAASPPLKAMILLGVNCGFGNADCGMLQRKALNLKAARVDFPRPKTGVERRCPLWPETVAAIEAAIEARPKPQDDAHEDLVFLTKYGRSWHQDANQSALSAEFRKLTQSLGIYRKGVGFYALRHVFETIGGESRDQVAVDLIMGHSDQSMGGIYRERVGDDRLQAVAAHVRSWLNLGPEKPKPETKPEGHKLRIVG